LQFVRLPVHAGTDGWEREAGEMDSSSEESPQIREWRRSNAKQARERQWIMGVMREFERRTPRRHRQDGRSDAATPPFSPAATATAGASPTPAADAPGLRDRPRTSVSPKLSPGGSSPLSRTRLRRRRPGDVHHPLHPAAAPPGGCWRPDDEERESAHVSGASPLGSSQQGSSSTATATSATTRSGVGRCSSSSCGVYSPVDVRTVGAGG
ncbi:unnamed protein product, partial [Ectocarpus sp. 8 AP-2014]